MFRRQVRRLDDQLNGDWGWSPGGFSWSIPNRYNRFSAGSAGTVFTNTLQAFTIDAPGTVTIAKGGASVSRSP